MVGEILCSVWDLLNWKSLRDFCMGYLHRTPADGTGNQISLSEFKDCPYFCASSSLFFSGWYTENRNDKYTEKERCCMRESRQKNEAPDCPSYNNTKKGLWHGMRLFLTTGKTLIWPTDGNPEWVCLNENRWSSLQWLFFFYPGYRRAVAALKGNKHKEEIAWNENMYFW